ncbi:DUF5691 domain-containing protein [Alienimonas chondri]|uniref:Uncharacterized protein n=1 Tax=Alienimonas chondri TaxID=2681879 RepID=A0ABX1VGN0_9PLAN|nr:DUF5691 domain-containing protein [Alienimonas chondri]NNJ27254.1 hypothetical protein [Alienimonas chondri]
MNERTRAAVVGLSKAGPSVETTLEELSFVSREGDTPEARFLLSVAAEDLWTEAGRVPTPAPTPPEPCDDGETPPLPGEVARVAVTICGVLDPVHGSASPEYLGLLRELCNRLAARGWSLPPATLPVALDAANWGRSSKSLRPAVAAAVGPRGRWLAQFNPEWTWLLEEAPDPSPESAADSEADRFAAQFAADHFGTRLLALKAWRAADPAAAREALDEVWKGETAFRRAALLESFEIGLSAADEPFLEAALTDRSKAVPAVAEQLLLGLPGSAFAAARQAVADLLLTLEKGRKATLVATLPPASGQQMEGDGGIDWGLLAQKPAPGTDRGVRAERLVRALACVTPSHWTERFERSPAELIALAQAGEKTAHGEETLAGWLDACGRFAATDPSVAADWAPALSAWLTERLNRKARKRGWPDRLPNVQPHFTTLLTALSPDAAAAFVTPLLTTKVVAAMPAELGSALWAAVPTPWPDGFARAVVAAVEQGRNKRGWEGGYEYHTWHAALPLTLERLPPAVLADLPPGWPTDGDPPQWLEKAIDALRLRRRIHELLP